MPAQEQDQHRLSFTLAVGPPTPAFTYFDWLGNSVHWFTVNAFHKQIKIVATSVVETDRPRPEPQRFKDTWPIRRRFRLLDLRLPPVRRPRRRIAGAARAGASLAPGEGHSLGELALAMMHLIADRFEYKKGITTAASPITDILSKGSGVCQDFTHLMIGLARALGIPARYVSGLVHPDAERFRGFTQTHAWCELFFPSAGWIGFDPANNCIVGGNFVKVAYGRDYRDVPPNKGQYTGKDVKETIDVSSTARCSHRSRRNWPPSGCSRCRSRSTPKATAPPGAGQPAAGAPAAAVRIRMKEEG